MTFQTDSQKRSCLERVRESDRALAELCREMEIDRVHDLAAYTIAVHVRQMLVRAFRSIDEASVKTGKAA